MRVQLHHPTRDETWYLILSPLHPRLQWCSVMTKVVTQTIYVSVWIIIDKGGEKGGSTKRYLSFDGGSPSYLVGEGKTKVVVGMLYLPIAVPLISLWQARLGWDWASTLFIPRSHVARTVHSQFTYSSLTFHSTIHSHFTLAKNKVSATCHNKAY